MSQIDLEKCREFIVQAKEYFMPEVEPTFFDVGLRGHYENPTTELLAFFLDPGNQHGLGDYFLRGLFDALALDYQKAGNFIRVSREIQTDGGRIDLLIEMENTVVVIECKIHHHVNNPFDSYESHVNSMFKNKLNKEFALLSIAGEGLNKSEENFHIWQGISYENLSARIKKYKTESDSSHKWQILANELLLQFENYGVVKMDEKQFEFTLKNLIHISQLKALENTLYDEISKRVENKITESMSRNTKVRHETWDGTSRVLRFSLDNWHGEHDCALCFYNDIDKPFMVRTWVVEYNKQSFEESLAKIPNELNTDVKTGESERYKGENWPRWDWWYKEIDSAIELVSQLILALDKIEKLAERTRS